MNRLSPLHFDQFVPPQILSAHAAWLQSDRKIDNASIANPTAPSEEEMKNMKDKGMSTMKFGPVHLAWKKGSPADDLNSDENPMEDLNRLVAKKVAADAESERNRATGGEATDAGDDTDKKEASQDSTSAVDPKISLKDVRFLGIDGVVVDKEDITVGGYYVQEDDSDIP